MSQPTLSVIMPNFNHAKFLPKSLGALLSQSRPADEILVLDDCSTDNSWQVLQAMAMQHPNLRCYRNEKNLGVVANNNRGLTLAKSDYVFLTAADDEVLPGLFEATMRILSAYPQAGLGCSVGTWADGATGKTLRFDAAMTQEPCFLPPERMVAMEQRGSCASPSRQSSSSGRCYCAWAISLRRRGGTLIGSPPMSRASGKASVMCHRH